MPRALVTTALLGKSGIAKTSATVTESTLNTEKVSAEEQRQRVPGGRGVLSGSGRRSGSEGAERVDSPGPGRAVCRSRRIWC